jgi:hypothetical protein
MLTMTIIKSVRLFPAVLSVVVPLSFIALPAQAMTVTIEPDDYAAGTDLSNISPYVTLQKMSRSGSVLTYDGPVLSTLVSSGPAAPTGDRTFGSYADGYTMGTALGLFFHEEVTNLSLLANNTYPFGVSTYWAAFDSLGVKLAEGYAGSGVTPGDNFAVNINVANMASVIIGASDGSNSSRLDALSFDIADREVAVPEPSGLMLLAAGALGMLLARLCGARRIPVR